jgi:two-component system, chemotaxis family, protein-glutamate methylesterase/glutaminase
MNLIVRDIVVIGASAGGVEACSQLLKLLPADFSASIFVVVHLAPQAPSVLAKILARHSKIDVKNPVDGEEIQPGKVYVALANQHLILKPGVIKLSRGPRVNGSRPSVDVLFRTAAYSYGERVIGVILSGALSDGTAGLLAIKAGGGVAIVQTPDEASFSGMPRSALNYVAVDFELHLKDIAAELVKLTSSTSKIDKPILRPQNQELALEEERTSGLRYGMPGAPTGLTCPDCGGAVWELVIERFKEFRCHVGHSFSPEIMLQEQFEAIDAEFWNCLRRLEENIQLRTKLVAWATEEGRDTVAAEESLKIEIAERQADFIRRALNIETSKSSNHGELK